VKFCFSFARVVGLSLMFVAIPAQGRAQMRPGRYLESLAERANDPTATLTQLQVKEEFTPSEYGTNAQPNTLLLRGILAVRPHGPLALEEIVRPTFQIVTKPLGKGAATRTGFGDTQLFDLFVMPWPNTHETGFRWAIGPYFIFPTASWHGAGDGAWQMGPAAGFTYRGIPHLVIASLVQQATSFAYTSESRTPVTSLTVQPQIAYEFAPDWYLNSNEATWKFDLRHATATTIPLSAGIGKIVRFSPDASLNLALSGEWMLYRQFEPQTEQFTLKLNITLLLPRLRG